MNKISIIHGSMLMNRKIIWIMTAFPCLVFALSDKNTMTGELYMSDEVKNKIFYSEKHFDHQYNPKNNIQSIFENKKLNTEIHFAPLDFNEEVIKEVSMEWLPLYDFSKSGDIEDYENSLKIPRAGGCLFRLITIKFPFF